MATRENPPRRDFKQKNDYKGGGRGQNERKVDYVILEWAPTRENPPRPMIQTISSFREEDQPSKWSIDGECFPHSHIQCESINAFVRVSAMICALKSYLAYHNESLP